jgi:hypothetical protein
MSDHKTINVSGEGVGLLLTLFLTYQVIRVLYLASDMLTTQFKGFLIAYTATLIVLYIFVLIGTEITTYVVCIGHFIFLSIFSFIILQIRVLQLKIDSKLEVLAQVFSEQYAQIEMEERIQKLKRNTYVHTFLMIFCYEFMWVMKEFVKDLGPEHKAISYTCIVLTTMGSCLLLIFVFYFCKANREFIRINSWQYKIN